jgi:cytochrome c553
MGIQRYLQSKKRLASCLVLVLSSVIIFGFAVSKVAHSYLPQKDHSQFTLGQKLATTGRENVQPCITCHGTSGEGNPASAIPRLAGLNAQYIKKQLTDFARNPVKTRVDIEPIARDYTKTPRTYGDLTVFTPGTRKHDVMNEIAKHLTAEEINSLAIYFSALPFSANPTAYDFETLERGEDLARRGKPEYGLPACDSCHGDKGIGHGTDFPPLAGQPPDYIIGQINLWQNGLRDNDEMALMRHVANQLTDGDKQNIAAYYANQSYSVNQE